MSRMAPPIPLARNIGRSSEPVDRGFSDARAPEGRYDSRRSSSDVESIINDISHDAARDTLIAWREHLIGENQDKGVANPEAAADSRILRALKAWQNQSGEFEWERSRTPANRALCEQDRVTKLISAGVIPPECVQNPDPEMAALNKYNYEKQVVGDPLIAIKGERNQRYKEAQARWEAEQEQKRYEIQKGYYTGARSEHERSIVRRGLQFAAEHGRDEATRSRAKRIIDEADKPINDAIKARGPQSEYRELPAVAQLIAQNPANVRAAYDFRESSPVYDAIKRAAPRQVEENTMPEREVIEKARDEAEKRLIGARAKLDNLRKEQEELKKRGGAGGSPELHAETAEKYREAEKLIQYSMTHDTQLLRTIQNLEQGGYSAYNARIHPDIRAFNELSRERRDLNKLGRTAMSSLEQSKLRTA
jgi:hypothetical protein